MQYRDARMGLPLALLLITTLTVGACGTSGNGGAAAVAPTASIDELVAAATKEGKVTIYSAQGLDALNNLAKPSRRSTRGSRSRSSAASTASSASRWRPSSRRKGIADMYVSASLPWVQTQAEAGSFLAPIGPELTGQGAYDAKQYVHDGNYFETNAAVLTFGWNTQLYPRG